jgi:hypothetical protein
MNKRHSHSRFFALTLWTLFGLGLLVQAFSPHLKIVNNAFVMPPVELNSGGMLNPSEVAIRERRLQALSGLLVLSGVAGLAFIYRRSLIESFTGTEKNSTKASNSI